MSQFKKACVFALGLLLTLVCLTTIVATLASLHFWLFLRLPGKSAFEKKQFFIPQKTGAYGVARLLESQEVIRDARAFYLLCWMKKSLHRLQAGEYAFSTVFTPEQVLDHIISGRVVIHTATLPEGCTIWDVARIFKQRDLAAEDELLELAKSAEFAKSLGIKADSLEGYLFPETYLFKKPVSSAEIAKAMVQQFWNHLPKDWKSLARENGLSLHEMVTLASIIEKEAVVDSERRIIAGVFYNRLRIRMPLQSDPTAVYDIPGFSGPVTAAHLTRQSPYNTYQIKGLPPGPICSPGAKSLLAAFHPEKVPYIYFVSNNDGTHQFSVTADEHRRAVSRYYEKKKSASKETPGGRQQAASPGAGQLDASDLPSQQAELPELSEKNSGKNESAPDVETHKTVPQ